MNIAASICCDADVKSIRKASACNSASSLSKRSSVLTGRWQLVTDYHPMTIGKRKTRRDFPDAEITNQQEIAGIGLPHRISNGRQFTRLTCNDYRPRQRPKEVALSTAAKDQQISGSVVRYRLSASTCKSNREEF